MCIVYKFEHFLDLGQVIHRYYKNLYYSVSLWLQFLCESLFVLESIIRKIMKVNVFFFSSHEYFY